MKLLQKTSRIYFAVSAALLLITGVLLYFFITSIIEEEAEEQLLANEKRIAAELKHDHLTTNLQPVIEITKLNNLKKESITIKDTTFYDEMEEEEERFLQVRSIRNIRNTSYQIILRQMIEEPAGYIGSIGLALAITMTFLLISMAVGNRRIFHKLWQPFYDSLEKLNNFSVNQNQPLQFTKSNIAEFEALNAAALKLTEKIRTDFRNLKEFTEDASHEIQTPLAIIQAKMEELLQAPELTATQASQIRTANAAVQKLSKLNHNLILLTKIENWQYLDKKPVLVNVVIQDQLNALEDFMLAKNLTVQFNPDEQANISADPVMVEMLVSNLLSNAIKHNLQNGSIQITLNHRQLTVSNTGEKLTIPAERLFERFVKADRSASSLGLGLAIVKSISTLYGWQTQYQTTGNQHSISILFS